MLSWQTAQRFRLGSGCRAPRNELGIESFPHDATKAGTSLQSFPADIDESKSMARSEMKMLPRSDTIAKTAIASRNILKSIVYHFLSCT